MNAAPRILIIRLSSLGDILHTLPALASLRAAYPDATIDWLVSKKCALLPSAVKGIDAVHSLDTGALVRLPPDASAWHAVWTLIRSLRAAHYDFCIDFQGLLKSALLGAVSGAACRLGFSGDLVRERPAHWFYHKTLAKPRTPVHVLELNRMLAALAGALPAPVSCGFKAPEDDQRHVESLLKEKRLDDFVVINPGGLWPTKRWSPEKYGILAKKIHRELGLRVAVTTGPGEENLYQVIADVCRDEAPVHLPVSFLQLIPLFERAKLLVGGDTGPFHLACALRTPVVGIFGPTSPVRNGPWRPGDEVVMHSLPCSACHGRTCPAATECMEIAVEEVFSAVVRRLQRGRSPVEEDF